MQHRERIAIFITVRHDVVDRFVVIARRLAIGLPIAHVRGSFVIER